MDSLVLIMLIGLPRSGKSTEAARLHKEHGYPIVCPDAIRLALHGQRFVASAEEMVWATAKLMVRSLFRAGHGTVVLDATNISRARRDLWRHDSEWVRNFVVLLTPSSECIKRANTSDRLDLVSVINTMLDQFDEPNAADENASIKVISHE